MGIALENVLDSVIEWRAGGGTPARGRELVEREPGEKTEAEIIRQNNEALKQIQAMMPGLGV